MEKTGVWVQRENPPFLPEQLAECEKDKPGWRTLKKPGDFQLWGERSLLALEVLVRGDRQPQQLNHRRIPVLTAKGQASPELSS